MERLLCAVVCEGLVDQLLERCHVVLIVDAAEHRLTDDGAAAVDDIGGREGHDVARKVAGCAVGGEVDVLVACALGFKQTLGRADRIGVAIEGIDVDADERAALLLERLVEGVQIAKFRHAGLAAAEPEVHDRHSVLGEDAAVHVVAVKVLAGEGGEGRNGGAHVAVFTVACGLKCGVLLLQGLDLVFKVADLRGAFGQRLEFVLGELILHKVEGGKQVSAVVRFIGDLVALFVHGGEELLPQLKVLFHDGVFLVGELLDLGVDLLGGRALRIAIALAVALAAAGGEGKRQRKGEQQRNDLLKIHGLFSFVFFNDRFLRQFGTCSAAAEGVAEADGLRRAGGHAFAAADTFAVVRRFGHIHVHGTGPCALAAGDAFALVNVHRQQRHAVEERVERAERAEPLAERAVEDDAQHDDRDEHAELPRKELAERGTDAAVDKRERDSAFEHALRAEIFAEERVAHASFVHHEHRKQEDHHHQDDVFEVGQRL